MALENLTPVTRREAILAGIPLDPVTREEYFLEEAVGGGGGGGVLICNSSYDSDKDNYVLDKTAGEIYDALLAGTPVYIKFQYGTLESYVGTMYLAPVIRFSNYTYTEVLRIFASIPYVATVSGTGYAGIPGVLVYLAGGLDEHPVFEAERSTEVNNTSMINNTGVN